jgi:ABC-type multidrug transport system fused ATPase/permease subunit
LAVIGFLFYSNWKFALMTFLILPFAAFVLVNLGKKSRKAGREGQAKMAACC